MPKNANAPILSWTHRRDSMPRARTCSGFSKRLLICRSGESDSARGPAGGTLVEKSVSMREIVLDTETTGLDPSQGHRLIEVGCIELFNRIPTGQTFHR